MPQRENRILANRLRSLAGELVGISKNIESGGLDLASQPFMFEPGEAGQAGHNIDDLQLAAYAERLYQDRRRRGRHFPVHLFAEPAWDILLDLFINGVRHRAISITSACIAGGIPATTGLRWLGVLEKEELLVREVSGDDARVTWVHLSQYGMDIMRNYIAESSGLFTPAPVEDVVGEV